MFSKATFATILLVTLGLASVHGIGGGIYSGRSSNRNSKSNALGSKQEFESIIKEWPGILGSKHTGPSPFVPKHPGSPEFIPNIPDSDGSNNDSDTNIINPFSIIAYILKIVLLPVWFPLRLVITMASTIGLLLLGCRVVPIVDCPFNIRAQVDDYIQMFEDEMQFYMGFENNVN